MNNNPKVLFVMHMPPPVHGASMVGKYIHDSKLINYELECYYLNPTTAKDLEDVGSFRIGKLIDVFSLMKKVKSTVKEITPDLVYFTANATGFAFYKDYLIVRALKKLGCKVVVHYHNKGVSSRQNNFLDNLLYKSFFNGLNVILLADNLYADVEKYISKDSVQICENGIPDEVDQIAEKDNNKFEILYLSNMMEEKGVWILLQACKELKERGVDFKCNFVGGWKDISKDSFQARIDEFGLRDRVKPWGPKYGEEKKEFLSNASVLVFPTYYHNECFPLVLLEGMMYGLACVSTNEAGIPSIIDNNKTGLIVEKQNHLALVNALEKLANNADLCKNMGKLGREKYERLFTLPVFEQRMVSCLKNLL